MRNSAPCCTHGYYNQLQTHGQTLHALWSCPLKPLLWLSLNQTSKPRSPCGRVSGKSAIYHHTSHGQTSTHHHSQQERKPLPRTFYKEGSGGCILILDRRNLPTEAGSRTIITTAHVANSDACTTPLEWVWTCRSASQRTSTWLCGGSSCRKRGGGADWTPQTACERRLTGTRLPAPVPPCASTIRRALRAEHPQQPLPQRHEAAEQQNQNKELFSDVAMGDFCGDG